MKGKSGRRWCQFGLRTLLVLFIPIAAVLGSFRVVMNRTIHQQQVVRQLEEFQPVAVYNDSAPWDPRRVVVSLSFEGGKRKPTDDDIARLEDLRDMERLDLSNTHITDAGLAHLAELRKMTHLELKGTRTTDEGLVHLRGMSQLEYVGLEGTQVTWKGVIHLMRSLPDTAVLYSGESSSSRGPRASHGGHP